jgi:membrane-bound lytic murein transglycosylase B
MRIPLLVVTAALAAAIASGAALAAPKIKTRGTPAAETPTYAARDDAMQFADAIASQHGLDAGFVRTALAQARFVPRVAQLIMPPPSPIAKNWAAYRSRFLEPTRIRAGADFWRANAEWLRRAEAQFGVPPQIVVGIVGVETLYGRQMGGFRVIDALATLAFDFPSGRSDRSGFFRDELAELFVLSARAGVDPLSLRGSYAGALGMAQFMPSSFNRHAVDFDGDGVVDLHDSAADVVGSIANYLATFGWERGLPTHFDVTLPANPDDRTALLAPDIVPSFSAAQFAERGATLPEATRDFPGLLALVELRNGDAAPSYVAGTSNFYAITRYNWSSYYAMAVIELGAAVAAVVGNGQP